MEQYICIRQCNLFSTDYLNLHCFQKLFLKNETVFFPKSQAADITNIKFSMRHKISCVADYSHEISSLICYVELLCFWKKKKIPTKKELVTVILCLRPKRCLLITFIKTVWTQTRPDKMSGLIWIQTVWHSDCNPERIFEKLDFEKISRRQIELFNKFFAHLVNYSNNQWKNKINF